MNIFKSNNLEGKKLFFYGAMHSLGVLAYVSLVVLFMSNAQSIFGKNDNFLTGVMVLLIFILSALVIGSLVLGRPILLYLDGKKAEAVKLLFYTIISLAIILAIVILACLGLK